MKTAISVPDELFESVTHWTSTLGIPRSVFFARAAQRYIADLEAESFTAEYDAALARLGEDESSRDAVEHSKRFLARDAEDW